ncbi:MAG: histidine phosphatase family protein [Lachnospiraceae bacterium]|nr:histidine phosphatase family protein [Lachnospiraceae bacterium]
MKLMIIRHGEPDYVVDGLTEKGKVEAKLLAQRLKDERMDEIYVSTLGRAKDTAEPTLKLLGRSAVELEWLKEFPPLIHRPDKAEGEQSIAWDWMPADWTKYPEFYDYDRWMDHPVMKAGHVREEYERVTGLFDEFLRAHGYEKRGRIFLATKPNNDTIVFFCHFGLTSVLLSYLLSTSPMIFWHGLVAPPSSVSIIATEERQKGYASFRMNRFGDVSHLTGNGEPVSFAARYCECYDNADEKH